MIVDKLVPRPEKREAFKRNRLNLVPDRPGCYVLATFEGVILYIGLSVNLRNRMNDHLDNDSKTSPTRLGRAIFFYWIETTELNKVERTWINIHNEIEGMLPILNSIYSPTST